jgi:hypothetical protein
MNIKRTQRQIKELKTQVRAAKRARNMRLLGFTLVLALLALAGAVMTGRIQLPW